MYIFSSQWHGKEGNLHHHIHIPVHFTCTFLHECIHSVYLLPMYVWFKSMTWKRGQSTSPHTYTCTFLPECISIFDLCRYGSSDWHGEEHHLHHHIHIPVHFTCTFLPECIYNFYLCRYGSCHWHGEEDHLHHHAPESGWPGLCEHPHPWLQ